MSLVTRDISALLSYSRDKSTLAREQLDGLPQVARFMIREFTLPSPEKLYI